MWSTDEAGRSGVPWLLGRRIGDCSVFIVDGGDLWSDLHIWAIVRLMLPFVSLEHSLSQCLIFLYPRSVKYRNVSRYSCQQNAEKHVSSFSKLDSDQSEHPKERCAPSTDYKHRVHRS